MLSSKNNRNKKIISTGNEKILSNDNKIAEVLNNFFSDIIKALVISPNCFFWFVYRWWSYTEAIGYC